MRSGPSAKLLKLGALRILQSAEVRSVHLRVAAETPEVFIDRCRVQKYAEPIGQTLRKTGFAGVEDVEVVFKTNGGRIERRRVYNVRYDAPWLFL